VQTSNGRTLKSSFLTSWTTTDNASKANTENNFIKKPPLKKVYAFAHCTHLPLLAYAHANPKAKSKECNRQPSV